MRPSLDNFSVGAWLQQAKAQRDTSVQDAQEQEQANIGGFQNFGDVGQRMRDSANATFTDPTGILAMYAASKPNPQRGEGTKRGFSSVEQMANGMTEPFYPEQQAQLDANIPQPGVVKPQALPQPKTVQIRPQAGPRIPQPKKVVVR